MSNSTTEDESDCQIIDQWLQMDKAKQTADLNLLLNDNDMRSPQKKKVKENDLPEVEHYVYSQQYSQLDLSDDEAIPTTSVAVPVTKGVGYLDVLANLHTSFPNTMMKIKRMWMDKGMLEFYYVIQGYAELGCSANEVTPFIARGMKDGHLFTFTGDTLTNIFCSESLNTEIVKMSISTQAMDEFIKSNHIGELDIVQNMNKLYDVIRGAQEKFVLSWHDNHTHAIIGLRTRKITDTSWYKMTKRVNSIFIEDGRIGVDFSRKQCKITTLEDFALYTMYMMTDDHCYVGASDMVWNMVYQEYRKEMGKNK